MFQLGHKLLQWKWMKMTEESYGKHTILHNVKASYQVITLHGSLDWHRTYEDEGVKWMKRWINCYNFMNLRHYLTMVLKRISIVIQVQNSLTKLRFTWISTWNFSNSCMYFSLICWYDLKEFIKKQSHANYFNFLSSLFIFEVLYLYRNCL